MLLENFKVSHDHMINTWLPINIPKTILKQLIFVFSYTEKNHKVIFKHEIGLTNAKTMIATALKNLAQQVKYWACKISSALHLKTKTHKYYLQNWQTTQQDKLKINAVLQLQVAWITTKCEIHLRSRHPQLLFINFFYFEFCLSE